eukprot:gene18625-25140_t
MATFLTSRVLVLCMAATLMLTMYAISQLHSNSHSVLLQDMESKHFQSTLRTPIKTTSGHVLVRHSDMVARKAEDDAKISEKSVHFFPNLE